MNIAERLRAALTENVGLKLLSFMCALLLYSLVHGSQDAQKSVSVDLVMLLPPDAAKRVLVSPLPPRVRVTLRGSRSQLDELHADDIGNVQLDAATRARDHTGLRFNHKAKPEHDTSRPLLARLAGYRRVPALTGACFAIRRTLWQNLGGFDDGFRNGGEDVDLLSQEHAVDATALKLRLQQVHTLAQAGKLACRDVLILPAVVGHGIWLTTF